MREEEGSRSGRKSWWKFPAEEQPGGTSILPELLRMRSPSLLSPSLQAPLRPAFLGIGPGCCWTWLRLGRNLRQLAGSRCPRLGTCILLQASAVVLWPHPQLSDYLRASVRKNIYKALYFSIFIVLVLLSWSYLLTRSAKREEAYSVLGACWGDYPKTFQRTEESIRVGNGRSDCHARHTAAIKWGRAACSH